MFFDINYQPWRAYIDYDQNMPILQSNTTDKVKMGWFGNIFLRSSYNIGGREYRDGSWSAPVLNESQKISERDYLVGVSWDRYYTNLYMMKSFYPIFNIS